MFSLTLSGQLPEPDYDPWVEDHDPPPSGPWSRSVDPEEQALLRHHVSRLPPRYRVHIELMLEGLDTAEVGRVLSISQPSAWLARQAATKRLRWTVENVPDLAPSQVEDILRRPATGQGRPIPERAVQMAAAYWTEWRTTHHPGWTYATMQFVLFRIGSQGWAYRLASSSDEDRREVGRGLLTIRDRPRFDRRRIAPIAGQEKTG